LRRANLCQRKQTNAARRQPLKKGAFLAAVERIIGSIEIQHDLGASVKDGNKHGGT
jgi:hypothetical protein